MEKEVLGSFLRPHEALKGLSDYVHEVFRVEKEKEREHGQAAEGKLLEHLKALAKKRERT